MRAAVHRFGLATAVVATLGATMAFGTAPASAEPDGDIAVGVMFHGTAHINCFGCGQSTGTAAISGFDPSVGDVLVLPSEGIGAIVKPEETATASYTVEGAPGVSCVITGSADGTTSGELATVTFHWLRVGAVAVISTTGEITGAGVAAFAVTSPALPRIPCGGPVDADVAGVLVGTAD